MEPREAIERIYHARMALELLESELTVLLSVGEDAQLADLRSQVRRQIGRLEAREVSLAIEAVAREDQVAAAD